MERVRIAALFADKEQYGGASVTVCGWAKTIRDMKTFGFIELILFLIIRRSPRRTWAPRSSCAAPSC